MVNPQACKLILVNFGVAMHGCSLVQRLPLGIAIELGAAGRVVGQGRQQGFDLEQVGRHSVRGGRL